MAAWINRLPPPTRARGFHVEPFLIQMGLFRQQFVDQLRVNWRGGTSRLPLTLWFVVWVCGTNSVFYTAQCTKKNAVFNQAGHWLCRQICCLTVIVRGELCLIRIQMLWLRSIFFKTRQFFLVRPCVAPGLLNSAGVFLPELFTFVLTLVQGTAKSYKNRTPPCDLPFYSFKRIGVLPNLADWVCTHVKHISQVNWLIDLSVSDFAKTQWGMYLISAVL